MHCVSPQSAIPLSSPAELILKDIHLPPPISRWPLAIGWWLVLGGALLLIILSIFLIKKWLRPTLKKEALKALDTIEKKFAEHGDITLYICDLSAFLRRASLSKTPAISAGITGMAWLQALDASLPTPEFSQGAGKILLFAPYSKQANKEEALALMALCRRWTDQL